MSDLISRQAAIDFIDAGHLVDGNEPRWSDNEVVNFLKSRPSAQPERCVDCVNLSKTQLLIPQPERKKGKWIEVDSDMMPTYLCSECGTEFNYWEEPKDCGVNYCPNCGADMRGGDAK